MKKLLLATTALLALSGAANATVVMNPSGASTGDLVVFDNSDGFTATAHLNGQHTAVVKSIDLAGGGTSMDVWCLDINDNDCQTVSAPRPISKCWCSSFPGLNNPLSDTQVRQIAALMFLGNGHQHRHLLRCRCSARERQGRSTAAPFIFANNQLLATARRTLTTLAVADDRVRRHPRP